jgi:hypothetical protein
MLSKSPWETFLFRAADAGYRSNLPCAAPLDRSNVAKTKHFPMNEGYSFKATTSVSLRPSYPRGGPGVPDEKECFFREARSVTVQPRYPLAVIQCAPPGNLPLGLPATLFP